MYDINIHALIDHPSRYSLGRCRYKAGQSEHLVGATNERQFLSVHFETTLTS
jgi:hypothetical protein